MSDVLTMIWKERKSMFRARGRKSQTALTVIMPILLAIYLPWQEGTAWFHNAMSFVPMILIPFILVGITIPDSFAGERERHTLGTLLASRLSDRSILVGKIAASVLFAWFATIGILLLSALTVNILRWNGSVMFYTGTVLAADLSLSLLVALMTAGAGVLISMRMDTVQGAQQALMMILMIPLVVIQVGGLVLLQSMGDRGQIKEFFASIELGDVALAVAAALLIIDLILIAGASVSFRRARLILS
jgi:ABC-2 type transport system permease protein